MYENLKELQIYKLIQSVLDNDADSVERLCEKGVEGLLNVNEPENGKSALIIAVQTGLYPMINQLLKLGADPNLADFKQRVALMYACQTGDCEAVDILCKHGCDVNRRDLEEQSCLSYCFIACTERHIECVRILLEHGADCNLACGGNETAFLAACRRSAYIEPICLTLLHKGNTNPFIVDKITRNSALHYAASKGSLNLCYALLKTKLEPNLKNTLQQIPAHLAAENGHLNILKLLFSFGADFNIADLNGNQTLHYLLKTYKVDERKKLLASVKYLLSRGSTASIQNLNGLLPKELKNNKKLQLKLIKLVKINVKKFKKIFSMNENDLIVNKAVDLKVEMFIRFSMSLFDLIQSVEETLRNIFRISFKSKEMISKSDFVNFFQRVLSNSQIHPVFLEKLYFYFNYCDSGKESFIDEERVFDKRVYLKLSSVNFKFEIKLRKLKVKKERKSSGEKKFKIFIPVRKIENENFVFKRYKCIDPLRFCEKTELEHEWMNDSRWYHKSMSETKVELSNVVNSGDLDTLKKSLHGKSEEQIKSLLDTKDKFYKTPLMISVGKVNFEMVEFLLSCKVDVNLSDNFKWTALHHAVYSASLPMVKLILENKAKLNVKSVSKKTPAMIAEMLEFKEIKEYLIKICQERKKTIVVVKKN